MMYMTTRVLRVFVVANGGVTKVTQAVPQNKRRNLVCADGGWQTMRGARPTAAAAAAAEATAGVASIAGQDNKIITEPVALVTNLQVHPMVHDKKARTLQLNISWTVPQEGRLPKGYFLKVKSINDSHEYCEIMDFMEDINNTMTSWAVVPPEVTNVKNDPRVMQECCYNIRVESQPYDGRRAAEVNYTIPERVGELWSCRRKALLPVPRDVQVSVIDSGTAHVSWTLDASAARIARNISLT
ncbi:uncharacterized protein LOC126176598 [Schistocerca cancellata]|uniref:uncharacterized protein LOC126176598 n=1 Tax=Schistocerca cancellata TaxID=274614 RepID=UPI0021179687|nr:uncharacterized protein LOC126176598 [Schistocerca cancellata]